jgi:c-di-GMP-binding flagellar brake protein YcgR
MSPERENGAEIVPHPSGRPGKLHTSSGDTLPVRTFDRGEEVLLIVLTDAEEHASPDMSDASMLEYTSARGVVRLHGEARREHESLLRFRVDGEPEVIQRRAHVRVHTPQPVRLEPATRGAFTIDVSGGGMLLAGTPPMRIGDRISFELALGGEREPVRGVACLVRHEPSGRGAFNFEEISERDRQRLIGFVFERMRNARAKTRGDVY